MNTVRHANGIHLAGVMCNKCDTLFFDPPWDADIPKFPAFSKTLAFCDGFRARDVIRRFGAPTWVFTWDCVSSWYTPNRPLRRAKYCFAYFDINDCSPKSFRFGCAGKPRIVSNSRGSYAYVPDGEKMFSDVYSSPITARKSNHKHAKPIEWLAYLMATIGARRVFDPFAGSGACSIAGIELGIKVFATEVDKQTQVDANKAILKYRKSANYEDLSLGI